MQTIRIDLDGRGVVEIRASAEQQQVRFRAPDGRVYRFTPEEAIATRQHVSELLSKLTNILEG